KRAYCSLISSCLSLSLSPTSSLSSSASSLPPHLQAYLKRRGPVGVAGTLSLSSSPTSSSSSSPSSPPPPSSSSSYLSWLASSAPLDEFAHQLTLLESTMFASIKTKHLVRQKWKKQRPKSKKDKEKDNEVSRLVA